jgi:hypothetical protein
MRSSLGVRRTAILVLASASAAVLGAFAPLSAQSLETGPIKVTDSGSITPNGYALKGVTGTGNNVGLFGYGTVASSAINIDGVVGYVQTPQSVGVVGWAQSTGTSAYGVYGYSATGPGVYGYNNNGSFASIYGYNTSGATAVYGNSTTGYGVYGSSGTEDGVVGTTSTASTNFGGVLGLDNASVGGNYGVAGQSTIGAGVGAFNMGTSTGQALFAESSGGSDTIDSYQFGSGMFADYFYADTGFFDGYFEAGNNAAVALYAYSDASGASFAAGVNDGVGASVLSSSGNPAFPAFQAYEGALGTYPFATYNGYDTGGGPGPNDETFIINDSSQYSTIVETGTQGTPPNAEDVQVSGDLYVQGLIFSACYYGNEPGSAAGFPVTGTNGQTCIYQPTHNVKKTSSGAMVSAYNASETLPIMEDFGEAQLVDGHAAVSLEKTFATTIDSKRSYLVFITPEGDCNVLYVATKTPAGFVVREAKGGRSTLAFQYRIVAHPFGDSSARLAVVKPNRHSLSHSYSVPNKTDPRSPTMLAVLAKSKSMRTAAAHRFSQRVHPPQKSALPLVNPALFRQ